MYVFVAMLQISQPSQCVLLDLPWTKIVRQCAQPRTQLIGLLYEHFIPYPDKRLTFSNYADMHTAVKLALPIQ